MRCVQALVAIFFFFLSVKVKEESKHSADAEGFGLIRVSRHTCN